MWWAIQRHNAKLSNPIDAVRVGDVDGPALGADDPEILFWAEQAGRILAQHLRDGHHSPGVFTIRPGCHLPEIVEFLVLVAFASASEEWVGQIVHVP